MKKTLTRTLLASLALAAGSMAYADVTTVALDAATMQAAPTTDIVINGTGSTAKVKINAKNMPGEVLLKATAGLKVYPAKIPAGMGEITATITLTSTLPTTTGQVILRSGDHRAYINVTGYGSELEQKDLSANPTLSADETAKSWTKAEGFDPDNSKGYTIEFKVRTRTETGSINAYAVTTEGAAFRMYVDKDGMGFYNGASKVAFSNPATAHTGGKSAFYNDDKQMHTYRVAVTSDKRAFVYRDGQLVTMTRTQDYGNQKEWAIADGAMSQNLIKNGDFEGEWNTRTSDSLVNKIEGWYVDPIDQYNCKYTIDNYEVDNDKDMDNHVAHLQRYNWNDGWGAGTISQIIDVVPGSTYALTALAGGGMDLKSGQIMSSIRIEEVQNSANGAKVDITNEDGLEEYSLNYTASADCNQIKVILHNERFLNGGGWGSNPKAFLVDDVVLVGKSRVLDQKVGFQKGGSTLEYFTFDPTGAYAPLAPVLEPEVAELTLDGTGESKTIKVKMANIVTTDAVTVTATPGIKVEPETLPLNQDGTITVTLLSTLPETEGQVIIRCGDLRSYIDVKGYGSELERKDLSESPVYTGSGNEVFFGESDGFVTDASKGYTIEFRCKLTKDFADIQGYAVTKDGASFKGYVESEALGLFNAASRVGLSNPATAGDGGKSKFYNRDGKAHTYRFTVTPDQRVFIYRDGMLVGTQRASDFGHSSAWLEGATEDVVENLLKNADFEGEWNTRGDGLVNRVEGWHLDPIDQYNCNYTVINREIDNEFDHNNHVMKLQRYNWNDGWGAGTVSQVVDVVPGETYTLIALAGGGMNTKTGEIMSSLRIEEVQNSANGNKVDITNEEGLEEYAMTYTTSADCNQIKVILYNERFLNGGGWGSSPKEYLVDNMVLSGKGRTLKQETGFLVVGGSLEYFTYDVTGAYAPMEPSFGEFFEDGIESAVNTVVSASVEEGALYVYNLNSEAAVTVYNSLGQAVAYRPNYNGEGIKLPGHGVYVCVAALGSETRTIKVAY